MTSNDARAGGRRWPRTHSAALWATGGFWGIGFATILVGRFAVGLVAHLMAIVCLGLAFRADPTVDRERFA
jgi:hypothetical protein